MFKRLIVFCVCLLFANVSLFYREVNDFNRDVIRFEEYVNDSCITGVNGENIYVVFNFENIEWYLKEYMVYSRLEKISLTGFDLHVIIKKGIFLKEEKLSFYLTEGDLYDSRN